MLYADSDLLRDLAYVVMDEVHYLADRFRGAVWEEVIIHLPQSVRLVSLSATVSNAEEFGDWLQTVRGETEVIVSKGYAESHHLKVGSSVSLLTPTDRRVSLRIVGITDDKSRLLGDFTISLQLARTAFGQREDALNFVTYAPGATDAQVAVLWPRWWQANRHRVGADPDRLLPGTRLVAPAEVAR